MPKKIFEAGVRVPELPRVRFMRKAPNAATAFADVTGSVSRLEILELENGQCALLRLDPAGAEVWRTLHASLDETRWQARFEYELPVEDWRACG